MVWHTLPEQILREDYALQLDNILAGIDTNHQWPRSDNLHSVFNLRHYLTYGGRLYNCNILKPPWVEVRREGPYKVDVCTLCKSKRRKLQPQCNDGHFQSEQHRSKVEAWKHHNKGISLHIGASTDKEATAAHAFAVCASTPCANTADVAWPPLGARTDQEAIAEHASAVCALTPCANTAEVAWPPPPPPWPPHQEATAAHASAVCALTPCANIAEVARPPRPPLWPPPRSHSVCVHQQEVNRFNISPFRRMMMDFIGSDAVYP